MYKHKFLLTVLFGLGGCCLIPAAGATPLLPGQFLVVPNLNVTGETGSLIASTPVGGISYDTEPTCNDICGSITEGVYRESGGTLDFVYQFSNRGPSGTDVISMSNYAPFPIPNQFSTDVQYSDAVPVDNGAGLFLLPLGANGTNPNPTVTNRTANGRTVSYNFSGTQGESAILIVKTNALFYEPGTASIHNDAGTPALAGFFAPVPEPGFYGVLAIGLAAVVLAGKFVKRPTLS